MNFLHKVVSERQLIVCLHGLRQIVSVCKEPAKVRTILLRAPANRYFMHVGKINRLLKYVTKATLQSKICSPQQTVNARKIDVRMSAAWRSEWSEGHWSVSLYYLTPVWTSRHARCEHECLTKLISPRLPAGILQVAGSPEGGRQPKLSLLGPDLQASNHFRQCFLTDKLASLRHGTWREPKLWHSHIVKTLRHKLLIF